MLQNFWTKTTVEKSTTNPVIENFLFYLLSVHSMEKCYDKEEFYESYA